MLIRLRSRIASKGFGTMYRVWDTPRHYQCVKQCEHLPITHGLIEQALRDEQDILRQKGRNNPTTLTLNQRMDFIGSLAHNGVCEKIEAWGIYFEASPFFSAAIHQDEFDFRYDGYRVDVQGTPARGIIKPWTSFLIKNEKEQKPMDYYCLTAVDLDNKILHIAGVIEYSKVWKFEHLAEKVLHPAHSVRTDELTGLSQFIFRTSPH